MKIQIPAILAIFFLALVSIACKAGNFVIVKSKLPAKDVYSTLAAQTVYARITISASISTSKPSIDGTPSYIPMILMTGNTPTPIIIVQQSITPTASLSPLPPTVTPVPPSPTPGPCNLAVFVQDINYPSASVVPASTKFSKIWRVKNVGSCTWDKYYTVMFVQGDALGAKSDVALPANVAPGASTDLIVNLAAPKIAGTYSGGWMIHDTRRGQVFGVGNNGTDYLWVNIKVLGTGTGTPTSKPATSAPTKAPTSAPPAAPTALSPSATSPAPSSTATATQSAPTSTNTPSSTPTNSSSFTGMVVSYRQTGGSANVCEDVEIYLNTPQIGQAIAKSYSCDIASGQRTGYIGGATLIPPQYVQFVNWVNSLKPYHIERNASTPGQPNYKFDFSGLGSSDYAESDVQQIQMISSQLILQIKGAMK